MYQQPQETMEPTTTTTPTPCSPCTSSSIAVNRSPTSAMSYGTCSVCSDRATGKHYGAVTCDGCKGFFRRSIRYNRVYYCRFQKNCTITKERRNRCRYCRLKRCLRAGQRREAVQNERKRPLERDPGVGEDMDEVSLEVIVQADALTRMQSLCFRGDPETMFQQTLCDLQNLSSKSIATADDVYDSTKEQLLVIVQWAKAIPQFSDLRIEDRITLLRTHAGENLILGVARRSMQLKHFCLLGNGLAMPRNTGEFGCLSSRILDELVEPFRRVRLDDTEFACLKAIVFFDPVAKGLLDPNRVKDLRYQIQLRLETYIATSHFEERGRFGEILLMLPSLHSISSMLVEQIQFAKLLGTAKIDTLLEEVLLGGELRRSD